ncbi:hypothetical protein PITC_023220 [Penicillium italicum]|uniref:Uncharacterized protein n=1 Tax=Penicillium italicum TaxID=40296 RepID=A0A0A2LDC5_PENIT|nr:hypothetical protein PITC_023220 [Penicillium italicum]
MGPLELFVLSSSSIFNHASLAVPHPRPEQSPSFTSPFDQSSPSRDTIHCRPHFTSWKVQRPMCPPRGHTDLQPTTEKETREEINEKKKKQKKRNPEERENLK